MAKKQVDNLEQMQIDLKHAIREYYLTENKEAILTIQELSTKLAVLHGFEKNDISDVDAYTINLAEHCQKMAMTYSYKAVLLLAMLKNTSDVGPVSLDEMARYCVRYYASRKSRGLKPEKDGIFCQEKIDREDVKKYLKSNQIKSLQRDGVIEFDGEYICFTNRVEKDNRYWAGKARKICQDRLKDYFSRLDRL